MSDVDVYRMLVDDLYLEFGFEMPMAKEIVEYLNYKGVLDYDTLKEVYIYGDDE